MNVSENVKRAYGLNSIKKHVTITFPDLDMTIGTDRMYMDTMRLSEALMSSDRIEFVGCISSKFSVQVYGITDDIKGHKISVKIHTDGTENEPIKLFNGVVDSAESQSNQGYKKLVAYDELYTKGNTDCAEWYKSLPYPVKMVDVRNFLFEYIGIEQEECELPNDEIVISQKYDPTQLKAADLIKSICQMNGALGIINREGKFEYRYIQNSNIVDFDRYKNVNYEEFRVKPVDKVVIRQSEDDIGVSYGDGKNSYFIQGNFFLYGLEESTLLNIAKKIHDKISGIGYTPFNADNDGLPYLECGDTVSYSMMDFDTEEQTNKQFLVIRRELSGIQTLFDSYSAEGEEFQSEFISSIDAQINSIMASYRELSTLKLVVYTYTNQSKYIVSSTVETEIIKISYSSMADTIPVFIATVPVNMDLDGNLIVRYYVDSVLYSQNTLKDYHKNGDQVLTISNYFSISKNERSTVTVTLQTEYVESNERLQAADISALLEYTQTGILPNSVIDRTPPSAAIQPNTIRAMLFAHGLSLPGKWDGTINISDVLAPITIGRRSVGMFSELMGLTTQEPIRAATVTEKFQPISIGRMTVVGIGASIMLDETIDKYVFSTERAAYYEYDAQYVSVDGSFRLLETADTDIPYGQNVISEAINLSHSSIHGIENATVACEGALVCAVSADGEVWMAYDGSEWIALTEDYSGMSKDALESLTIDQWAVLLDDSDTMYIRISLATMEQAVMNITVNFIN